MPGVPGGLALSRAHKARYVIDSGPGFKAQQEALSVPELSSCQKGPVGVSGRRKLECCGIIKIEIGKIRWRDSGPCYKRAMCSNWAV